MLPPLTLMSFKARDVALKSARLLIIGYLAFCEERTIVIVSKLEYTTWIRSRPVMLGVFHLSGIPF